MADHITRVREQAVASVEKMRVVVRGDKYRMSVDFRSGYVRGQIDLASRLTREKIADAVEEAEARWQMQFELFRAGEDTDPGPKAEFVADAILALMVEGEVNG